MMFPLHRLPRAVLLAATAMLGLAAPLPAAAEPSPRTIIVLDGSGSMWGVVGGQRKLAIARATVEKAMSRLPAESTIGLMAYGHRRRSDCADIELIVPPAPGAGPAVSAAVQSMHFLGMTPLAAALRKAAEALRYTDGPATVVLVTDGSETCDADPCATAAELKASGPAFTAHVIGLGLTREDAAKVACIAQATGGRYMEANDAATLDRALAATLGTAPAGR
ncbi:vWA domain-containing protein [Xanthobacter sediminis]